MSVESLNSCTEAVEAARAIVRESVAESSVFDGPYAMMNMLATIVASYGLLSNSPAVVIGAMIIAMLLGPISGVGMALVDGDNSLLRKALLSLFGGLLVVAGTAFCIGLIHREIPATEEMMARTAPTLMDLMIALGGGAAGAFAVSSQRLSVAFVGVAIATALVPPLATCSMFLARGEFGLAGGAFLLTFTNIVAIQFASSVVFLASGYNKIAKSGALHSEALLRNGVSIVTIIALGALLTLHLRNAVGTEVYENTIQHELQKELLKYPGSYLASVRTTDGPNISVVRAIIRGPNVFTPEQVAQFEATLPLSPKGLKSELRLRFVHVDVISAKGVILSAEESAEPDK
jgi:uncharacterized hydrophobic protein (TIGR00271 family)